MANPFFCFGNKYARTIVPLLKFMKFLNKNAMTPEHKVDLSQVPEHIHPWLYDFDNPLQRKSIPVQTFIEMATEVTKIEEKLKIA